MSYIEDKPNNWQRAEFDHHADVLTCSRCNQPCCEHEVDNDASEAFEHVCRECADAERAAAAAEDSAWRAERASGFAAAADGIVCAHFRDADVAALQQQGRLATMPDVWQAREQARLATVPPGMPRVARPCPTVDTETALRSREIAQGFDKWWLVAGEFHWQQLHYRADTTRMEAARETARLAWMVAAVKATEVAK